MKAISKIIFIIIILAFNTIPKVVTANQNKHLQLLIDILVIKDDFSNIPEMVYEDAANSGYNVDLINGDLITLEILNNYRLVILSSGTNFNAVSGNNMRTRLQEYVTGGGKLIIEGGQTGYATCVFPLYPAFRNKVLKVQSWLAHNGGDLLISNNQIQSDLANFPNKLPQRIHISFSGELDQDVCNNGELSEIFYKTSLYENGGGIIVAPNVTSPQIIVFCFSYSSVASRSDAKNLLINSIYNLIYESVGINNYANNIPGDFALHQNYPNPFNPNTVINYAVKENSLINLKLYDALGREIATLVNKNQGAGNYNIKLNASDFSSGFYFYSLFINGDLFATKKMFLLK